eukprot:tig00020830_g14453.t1
MQDSLARAGRQTPLIAAAERGDEHAVRTLLARPETEVDATDAAGSPRRRLVRRTALLAACATSAPALALLLLERGADPQGNITGN